jgi:hypothetical protein
MDDGIDGCSFTLAILKGVLCDIGCDFLSSIYEGYYKWGYGCRLRVVTIAFTTFFADVKVLWIGFHFSI